jgi:hypothetical protein
VNKYLREQLYGERKDIFWIKVSVHHGEAGVVKQCYSTHHSQEAEKTVAERGQARYLVKTSPQGQAPMTHFLQPGCTFHGSTTSQESAKNFNSSC